jgi:hypothetical protein
MRGHKVNLDRDTTSGRSAAVRSRRDRERSVLTTHCSVGMTIGTTSGDGQAGCARAVDGSGTCRRKARLEGRHTSDGVCAVARSSETRGKGRAKPRLDHRANKWHEGLHRDNELGTRHHLRACCRGSSISSNALGATGMAAGSAGTATWLEQNIEHVMRVHSISERKAAAWRRMDPHTLRPCREQIRHEGRFQRQQKSGGLVPWPADTQGREKGY